MRIAFTIVLNGLKHFAHNNYFHNINKHFDYWIIVEGVAAPTGSTSWCKPLPPEFHKNFLSNDGTTEFLDAVKSEKIIIIRPESGIMWASKDAQVNAAINKIKTLTNNCFLWQIDVDEQWTEEQLKEAENFLVKNNGKTGCFLCNYYVGTNQIAIGDWGEGRREPYRRLWWWEGEKFVSHEPPVLEGKNGPGLLLNQKFNHFAYYFEEDIKFKEIYYGYDGLYNRWIDVQKNKSTIHIKALLGEKNHWGNTNTFIVFKT